MLPYNVHLPCKNINLDLSNTSTPHMVDVQSRVKVWGRHVVST